MAGVPLEAHSLTEVYYYLMVLTCPSCNSGPFQEQSVTIEEEHINCILRLECKCLCCHHLNVLRFSMDSQYARTQNPPIVNATDLPSRLLDVVQWMTLFHTITSQANNTAYKPESPRLGYEAALCLDEALKFFGGGFTKICNVK